MSGLKKAISLILIACFLFTGILTVNPSNIVSAAAEDFSFIDADTTTAGLWKAKYGTEGVILPAYLAPVPDTGKYYAPADGSMDYKQLPSYLTGYSYNLGGSIAVTTKQYLNPSKPTILEPPSPETDKVEACAGGYAPIYNGKFYARKYYFNINDTGEHTFTFYTYNYNNIVKLYSGVNTDLSGLEAADLEYDLSSCGVSSGLYVTFKVRGSFTLILPTETPLYTGISGFFFGDPVIPTPAPTPTPAPPDTQSGMLGTDSSSGGLWKGKYGSDGVILPGYLYAAPDTGAAYAPADGSADYKILPGYLSGYSYNLGGGIRVNGKNSISQTTPEQPDASIPKVDSVAGGYASVMNGIYYARRYYFDINDNNEHQFTFYTRDYNKAVKIYKGVSTSITGTEPADLEYDLSGMDVSNGLYVTFMIKGGFTLVLSTETPFITGISGFFFDSPLEGIPQAPAVENLPARTVRLAWNNAAANDMAVERGIDGKEYKKIAVIPNGINEYTDGNLEAGARYYYRIRYADGFRNSLASEPAEITIPAYQLLELSFRDAFIETTVDQTITISAVLRDSQGSPVAGRLVSFTLGGTYVGSSITGSIGTVNTGEDGSAAISYNAVYGGEYTITAYTPDDDIALTKSATAVIPLTVNEPVSSSASVIFKTSEAVKPGGLLSLYGDGMYPGQTTVCLADGTVLPIVQSDENGRFVTVDVPESVKADIFEVIATNNYGSATVFVNAPEPRWILDTTAFKGMTVGIYGRNMDASEFCAPKATAVQLVNTSTGGLVTPEVTESNPFAVRFKIQNEPEGEYYLEVRTMEGKPWVRLQGYTLSIVEKTEDSDPLGLGVSWARDFNWSNKVNAASVGITGDGTTDQTDAINAQINAIADAGGGVLFFPDGTYSFTQLRMRANVVIQGESKEGTILSYIGTGGNGVICEPDAVSQGRFGFANLKFTTPDDCAGITSNLQLMSLGNPWGTPIQNLTATRIFLFNLDLDFSLTNTKIISSIVTGASGKALISGCSFKGYNFAPYSPYIKDELVVTNNSFDYTAGFIALRAKRFVFEDNTITGHYIEYPHTDPNGLHGLATNPGGGWVTEHNYWAGNTMQHIGTKSNDGETLLGESPLSHYLSGHVIRADANSALLGIDLKVPGVNYKDARNDEWQIIIINGKGLGQIRKLASMTDKSVTVDSPWDIIPNSTSKFVLLRTNMDLTFYNNLNVDATVGICFYMNSYDNIIADNTGEDILAMSAAARQLDPNLIPNIEPNYFINIKRNIMTGKSWNYGTSYIGLTMYSDSDPSMPKMYGSEIKGNSIDRAGHEEKFDIIQKQPAGIVMSYAYPVNVTGRGIYATLVEGNTVKNSKYGIYFAKGVSGTTLKNNTFINISDMIVYDEGALDTVVVEGVPNSAPGMLKAIELTVDEGKPLTFAADALDADGDVLNYSAANLPKGALLDPVSGIFSWTPGFDQVGSCKFTLYADDGYLTASTDVSIKVNDVPAKALINDLSSYMQGLDIKQQKKKLLLKQLEFASEAIDKSKYKLALVKMKVFLAEVKILLGKELTEAEADAIADAGIGICMAIRADAQGMDKSWVDEKTEKFLSKLAEFKTGKISDEKFDAIVDAVEGLTNGIKE